MKSGRYDSAKPILKTLHWLPVKQRIEYKMLLLTYKGIHNLLPSYLCELLTTKSPTRVLRSNKGILLEIPKSNTNFGERAFSAAGPTLWNKLPSQLREAKTIERFKKDLKTHLFCETYQ